jgi:hypothetical protein
MPTTALLQQVSPLHQLPLKTASRRRALTPQQALDLRDEYRTGVSVRVLGPRYGIHPATAHKIATGQLYTELNGMPNPKARMPWVDPIVRRRGGCDEAELRALAPMLEAYPRRRALVKQTKLQPHLSPCTVPGVTVTVERDSAGYSVYVQWAGQRAA